ncbi:MAG: flagellar biosynthetic protein FliR [Clostridium sp.]|jgi:flagellar biosynthetic protein FliR|nr:flagellar biosynthetic protein FliR [Clostridium sp.]
MVQYAFATADLEYFLLIFTRVSCFVFIAPFFSLGNTPARIRIGISFFTSVLLYSSLTPASGAEYQTVVGYAGIVIREAATGLLIGLGATVCTSIVNFAGSIADMETGLSMVTLMDPATNQSTSITGAIYQYVLMLLLIGTGMYRYLLGALADSFVLIPVNGAVFRVEALLQSLVTFLGEYLVIGFRICLPVFCVSMLLNAVLGILAKVSPQMNMFVIGIQLKILVGIGVLFLTTGMLPSAADFVFLQMKKLMVSFVEGLR